jgi:hypothetical protein
MMQSRGQLAAHAVVKGGPNGMGKANFLMEVFNVLTHSASLSDDVSLRARSA